MNNKPYAWINVNDEYKILFDDELPNCYPEAWIPLYTHPVKELTDEEICNLIVNKVTDADMIKQALRKAQEK
jgi:hypothetical protein